MKKNITRSLAVAAIIAALAVGTALHSPNRANAQSIGPGVPIDTGMDFNSIMSHMKDFVLDRAATLMAKQLLHQMTVSVVNWINTGFNGSPAFLTNPEGFFLDAADQVTGEFLAQSGPLSTLCSPFSIDIRLNLAMQQVQPYSRRYTCTLGSVIQNVQNARAGVSIGQSQGGTTIGDIVSGNALGYDNGLNANGSSINSYYDDFSQGGWPAFMSSLEPQNNPYGAYLQAQSDLNERVIARQAAINNDLNRGRGFLSWQDCTDVTEQWNSGKFDPGEFGISVDQTDQLKKTGPQSISTTYGSNLKKTVDSSGNDVYKDCTVKTPGSVIAGTLEKQLNVPADELELANNINAVVDALISQMTTQLISGGLSSLSSSRGGRISYTSQVIGNLSTQNALQAQNIQSELANQIGSPIGALTDYKRSYDDAIAAILTSKHKLTDVQTCFANKIAAIGSKGPVPSYQQSYADKKTFDINIEISVSVDPLLAALTAKQADAFNLLSQAQSQSSTPYAIPQSAQELQTQVSSYSNAAKNSIDSNAALTANLDTAKTDLDNANKQALKFTQDAAAFQTSCDAFPGNALGGFL